MSSRGDKSFYFASRTNSQKGDDGDSGSSLNVIPPGTVPEQVRIALWGVQEAAL